MSAALNTALEKHIADKKFRVKVFALLVAFFVLLLINFLIFSSLNSSNTELSERLRFTAHNTSNLQEIDEQVKSKERLLKDLGWDGGVNKSKLLDNLAALLPADVAWTEVNINPIDQLTSRAEKKVAF
jgi:hypothetical protein